jgi:hypothetical protein
MIEMSDGEDARAPTAAKPSLKQRLTALFEDYGRIAIITYFTLSGLAIVGFSIAIWAGTEPSSATGVFGVIFAGWAAAKVTMPIRILITLAVTPLVALVLGRSRRMAAETTSGEPPPDDATHP